MSLRRADASDRPVSPAAALPRIRPGTEITIPAETEARARSHERALTLVLAAVVLLGAAVRLTHVLSVDFPLNDGGLFYQMVRDIQAHNYSLPQFTTYNTAEIPLAYSPLGFYVAAAVDHLTPFSLLDLFRLLPFVYSVATLVAFALLARRLLRVPEAVVGATIAFALIPRSFIWLLMGGGVTRGLGLALALIALHEAHRLFTTGDRRFVLTTGFAYAATVLAHLETGWFAGFSIALFWIAYGRSRESFIHAASVASFAAVLTAPWWLTIALYHGLGPFIEANASGGNVFSSVEVARSAFLSLARVTSTSEPLFPVLGALGFLGTLVALRTRHLLLPCWWVAIVLLDIRAFPTFTSVPVALLAGLAISQVVVPFSHYLWDRPLLPQRLAERFETPAWLHVSRGAAIVGIGLVLYASWGATLRAPGYGGEAHFLVGLSEGERDTMAWISRNTPRDATFLLIPRGPWQADKEAEWFPVLANRQSVATVQGTEWKTTFTEAVRAWDDAWDCGYNTADCLLRWSMKHQLAFTHIYVPREEWGQCCGTLVESLRRSGQYSIAYDGPGGTVFASSNAGSLVAAQ